MRMTGWSSCPQRLLNRTFQKGREHLCTLRPDTKSPQSNLQQMQKFSYRVRQMQEGFGVWVFGVRVVVWFCFGLGLGFFPPLYFSLKFLKLMIMFSAFIVSYTGNK